MSAYRSSAPPVLLGNMVYLPFESVNTSDVLTNVDTTPACSIYAQADFGSQSNPITGVTVSAVSGLTGTYVASRSTASGFAVGNYTALITYALSEAGRQQLIDFAVV